MTETSSHTTRNISVTSLEHGIWPGLKAQLEPSLARLGLARLAIPVMLLLHDAVDMAVRAMHFEAFRRLAEDEFGMVTGSNAADLEALFNAEVGEHGSQNIAQYCKDNGQHVQIGFPQQGGYILSIAVPVAWDVSQCGTQGLVDALGLRWQQAQPVQGSTACIYALEQASPDPASARSGVLLDDAASQGSMQHICNKLGYGLIRFSSAGEVIAVSRAMLDSMRLPAEAAAIADLCTSIPFNFYNDVIWGLALTGEGGVFENYRTRVYLHGEEGVTALFNVSGYRDADATIHSLWQIVSLDEGTTHLGEGSILSEARIHNITRNYVPQMVEEKAREAVQLGKSKLINEECEIAVLFCDIVGFTSFVESNASSESIINTLNTILRRVSGSVRRNRGYIDKFMGDSVMAIFMDPADAIAAAIDMQKHAADINGLRSRAGQDSLSLRIGIHWGEVVIGNVGTAERLDWTAIGDVVNTASRIEKNCNPGAILISQSLMDAVDAARHPEFAFGDLFTIHVKGKRQGLPVCHVAAPEIKTK
ncbi:MAG: adenylate/guanylate cyclase domain-containing protein [Gammaproteobacteria bacterium]|nr:adenylate/guanylate cyclase domain-containing protein [Sideroxydans sp.]MBU3904320.1 adenylate/guanylate cyclase domain-containing protein [Gammaproteobacteria bacterium]MBU4045066.1 adenylate/guanylate cyclase domain-containing protein [Gammaproteobacteria bacterium]MBU4150907.1 adenylate/guanylate cyclase domain-containing protein [Gammaproteobacteria bacterium]